MRRPSSPRPMFQTALTSTPASEVRPTPTTAAATSRPMERAAFSYDLENHLLSVTVSSTTTSISYDPLGRLRQVAASAMTQFLYDGDKLSAEYDGSGNLLRRYVHGAGTDEPLVWYEGAGLATRNWLHTDNQHSVVATTDGSGSATVYAYGPYGEPIGASWTGSRFRYTGQIAIPEVALYYYKARFYDPLLGRFLQTDPIGYKDNLNVYEYTGDDPSDRVDSSGKISCGYVAFCTFYDSYSTPPACVCESRNFTVAWWGGSSVGPPPRGRIIQGEIGAPPSGILVGRVNANPGDEVTVTIQAGAINPNCGGSGRSAAGRCLGAGSSLY